MLIEAVACIFGYDNHPVVQAEELRLRPGRCLGIFGPNGSGKTTLVRGLTGLLPPLAGKVVRKENLRVGYLPQHRAMESHWPMSALDAALLATSARRRFGWVGRVNERVIHLMQKLGVDDLRYRSFSKLSGGQQQRILLAGTLASEPHLLLLDEPTGGLDIHSREILLKEIRSAMAGGLGAVVISHDIEDLMELDAEIAWLHPANAANQPSRVEIVSPQTLAGRMVARRTLK